jgi:hypothetical protein
MNQRKLITDGDDLTVKSDTGLLVSPGGGPVRTTGILVNVRSWISLTSDSASSGSMHKI